MAQNIYMASVAFFVPLRRFRTKFKMACDNFNDITFSPFVLFPNASCKYISVGKLLKEDTLHKIPARYKSLYNDEDEIVRNVELKPYVISFNLANNEQTMYVLVLVVCLDKVCGSDNITPNALCYTELDLIYLKKAFFDNGLTLTTKSSNESLYKWLEKLLLKLEGRKRAIIKVEYSVTDVCVWNRAGNDERRIDVDRDAYEQLSEAFKQQFYAPAYSSIDNFLESRIATLSNAYRNIEVSEKKFVYGLLFANENFMMAHHATVDKVIGKAHSNNEVEKYWAGKNSIVHIKTHSPYFLSKIHKEQKLNGDLAKVDGVIEMCMLLFLKRKLKSFELKHSAMRSEQMSKAQSEIAKCFYTNLFNQEDLDNKISYYITQFCLKEMFNGILNFVLPKKSGWDTLLTHKLSVLAICVTMVGVIVSVIIELLNKHVI